MSDVKPSDDPARVSVAATVAAPDGVAASSTSSMTGFMATAQRVAGRYEILNLLGTGGMGAVYRARDVELDEVVALKVLRRELVDSPAMLARFRQEAKLARHVTHRNVARTFDIGEHDGEKFLTMEFVDGDSLGNLLARRGRLSLAEVSRIADEVLSGIAAAHAAGVVHRDLKPDNVLLGTDGRVVVTDFGIARGAMPSDGAAKTMGGIVGTPAYMAPEQVEGAPDIDARADLYAFGAMLYELLVGARAWPGEAPLVVAAARLIHPPPDPRVLVSSIPTAVAEVIVRCMARQRADRYATADEVANALRLAVSEAATPDLGLAPTSGYVAVPVSVVRPGHAPSPSLSLDKTIAVLPFKNGGPPEDAYLADGITDDLIDLLSMTRGLKVRPRGAVAHFGEPDVDPRRAGEELNVQVVALGSVRRSAGTIRVTARLVSTSDGFQLWAKRFDRPAADVLAVNDEAAQAIAEALTVGGTEAPRARAAPTNPQAIDLYLRAQHEYHKFWKADVARAAELYDEALALAPSDPTILAGAARARVRLAFFGGEGTREMLARARDAADRAVAGAPEMGESWVALASARMMGGDAPGAARAVVTALEKSKGLAPAHELLGRILAEVKGPAEAISHFRTALAIDPSNLAPRFELARAQALLRDWSAASALLDLPAPGPSGAMSRFIFRARTCLWQGKVHPDLDTPPAASQSMIYGRPPTFSQLLESHVLPDDIRERVADARKAVEPGSRRHAFLCQIAAEFFAYCFEVDRAIEALGQGVDAGLIDVVWMDLCAVLDPIRDDARFRPLRATVHERAERVTAALRG